LNSEVGMRKSEKGQWAMGNGHRARGVGLRADHRSWKSEWAEGIGPGAWGFRR
jgi:hypothetical protein